MLPKFLVVPSPLIPPELAAPKGGDGFFVPAGPGATPATRVRDPFWVSKRKQK